VVDVGTATTYDVVNPNGQYIGGVIAPGIEVSLDGLRQRAAQLRTVELVRPRTVVARNTVEAMQAGAVFGAAGQIEGVVGRILAEQGWQPEDVTVVATGGLAPLVVPECTVIDEHQPWLTLLGLRLVFDRNV
jgi:type III pantothenate kinase